MITRFLHDSGDYQVTIGDVNSAALTRLTQRTSAATAHVDANDPASLRAAMQGQDLVISALSFSYNPHVAEAALEAGISYFDLTEDVQATARVRAIASQARPGQIFVPQCGLAPGFISIIAHDLCKNFDSIDTVRMRVGALPLYPTDALKYNLTWSTDGLINEYCNPCDAIHEGGRIDVLPLEGYEQFSLDGVRYEAFNTSGGLGTLCETLDGKVTELNYKTIRYTGHRDLVKFLVQDLRLGHRRELLKDILERAVPITFQDVVITFCTVKGSRRGQFVQLSDARKVYHQTLGDEVWSAIQITTAAGICAVIDLFCLGKLPSRGFVRQEEVSWQDFRTNRFGKYYDTGRLIDVGHDAQSG
jgi:saccharopine dehydrogenase-like NADP-dependent oxidoreductase